MEDEDRTWATSLTEKGLNSQDETHCAAWYAHLPYLCVCLRERTVSPHTCVGRDVQCDSTLCMWEREQKSESYIVSSAVKSVDNKREYYLLSLLGHRLCQSTSVFVCLLASIPLHNLSAECAIWFYFFGCCSWTYYLECLFCRGVFVLDSGHDKKWVMSELLCVMGWSA